MPKYISILRGINVGGKRKLLMTELKELYKELDFESISSYIQSGNLIFNCSETNTTLIESLISDAIFERFGYKVPVIVKSSKDWKEIIRSNPFTNKEINSLHITLLKEEPSEVLAQAFESIDFAPEQFRLIGQCIYIKCQGKYHQSKLSNAAIEKHLKVEATTRNWKTAIKLTELLDD